MDGNVAISYTTLDNGWNSSVTFNECTFVKGYAEHYGGGLYMEAILRTNSTSLKYFSSSRTILTLVAVNFTNNTAKTVGAGFYLQVHENPFLSATASIHFSFCIFKGNLAYSAQGGTAAHVVNYHLPGSVKHQIPQYNIVFDECLFVRNGHLTTKDHVQLLGCGTLYIAENALTLVKDSEFLHNHCSGITAVQSSIVLSGLITIANNTAYNGGGVLLCANSIIFLSLHVSVTIEENLASNFGGGIYAEFECSQAVPPCFYGTETISFSCEQ